MPHILEVSGPKTKLLEGPIAFVKWVFRASLFAFQVGFWLPRWHFLYGGGPSRGSVLLQGEPLGPCMWGKWSFWVIFGLLTGLVKWGAQHAKTRFTMFLGNL